MRVHRTRRGIAALAAVTATAGLALLAPSVNAAPIATTLTPDSAPTIFANTTAQTAGDWDAVLTGGVAVGDTLTIQVDDNDAGDANCAASNDTLGFNGTPTAAVTLPATGGPAFTVTTASSAGACTVANVKNQVVLTATSSSTADPINLTISGVKYDVGSAVDSGPINVSINGGGNTTTDANAEISLVRVVANNPALLLAPSQAGGAISNIVLTESAAGVLTTGTTVCVEIDGPAAFDDGSAPTVTGSGGGIVTGNIVDNGGTLEFDVTTASTGSAGTITIGSLKLDATAGTGPVTVDIGTSACGSSDIASQTVIAGVGTVNRIGGGDRYATAQLLFNEGGCADDAVLATGVNFPDALSASYLAGDLGTGILLTETGSLPAPTTNALRQNGVQNVFLVGGPAAISVAVENALKNTNTTACGGGTDPTPGKIVVTRIAGADRFATARAVAEFPGLNNAGTTETGIDAVSPSQADCSAGVRTAIVASGENFPDALAAGTIAWAGADGACPGQGGSLPLLLTNAAVLSPAANQALTNLNIKQVILMGGNVAVTPVVQAAIAAANGGINVVRVGGANRQETAKLLATISANENTFNFGSNGSVFIARGDNFPDALAAGPVAGLDSAPILLSDSNNSLGTAAAEGIQNVALVNGTVVELATLVGGTAALSATVASQVAAALASQAA